MKKGTLSQKFEMSHLMARCFGAVTFVHVDLQNPDHRGLLQALIAQEKRVAATAHTNPIPACRPTNFSDEELEHISGEVYRVLGQRPHMDRVLGAMVAFLVTDASDPGLLDRGVVDYKGILVTDLEEILE